MSHTRVLIPEDASAAAATQLATSEALAGMSLNGMPAGAAMPVPAVAGPYAHMGGEPAGGTPYGDLDMSQTIDVTNPDNQQECRLLIEFNTSSENLSDPMNQSLSTWSAAGTAHRMFTKPLEGSESLDLDRVVIMDMQLLNATNTFPYTVGLAFTGGATSLNTLTDRSGVKVAVALPPGENARCEQSLYRPDPVVKGAHFRNYAHCTKEGLMEVVYSTPPRRHAATLTITTQDIVTFKSKPYVYVPKTHPVIRIILKNQRRLNLNLTEADLKENSFYRIDGDVVNRIVDELHQSVLSRMPFFNLNSIEANLKRMDNRRFNDPAGSKVDGSPNPVQIDQVSTFVGTASGC